MDYPFINKSKTLTHIGILGMKWGKRKSSSEVSAVGQKKASDKYKKTMIKVERDIVKGQGVRQIEAYNKTANEYNNGKIAAFNKTHNADSVDYNEKYAQKFNKDWRDNFNKMQLSDIKKNKNYQKAQELVKKYDLESFDSLSQKNRAFIKEMEAQYSSD